MGLNLERVTLYRVRKHLTKQDVAKKIQISTVSYCRKEAGITDFTSKEIRKLAQTLEVSISDLFDLKPLF